MNTMRAHFFHGLNMIEGKPDTSCRRALFHVVRDGGSAAIDLLSHWCADTPDAARALAILPTFSWLVRAYHARSDDTNEPVTRAYYADGVEPKPAGLETAAIRLYRNYTAFAAVHEAMCKVRAGFKPMTPAMLGCLIPTRAGLRYSMRDLRAATEGVMQNAATEATRLVAEQVGPDGPADPDPAAATARAMRHIPGTLLMTIYIRRFLLGVTNMSTMSEFAILGILEQVLESASAADVHAMRCQLHAFFTRVVLFMQGISDTDNERALPVHILQHKKHMEHIVSLGMFWVDVLT